jgi:two-component system OmpR family response regulator
VDEALVFGGVRAGLAAEAIARGVRLIAAGGRAAVAAGVALRYPGAACPAHLPTLHVVDGDDGAVTEALDAGAHDAVPAAASDALIAARLAALLRRSGTLAALRIGPLTIDRVEHTAMRDGRPLGLRPREYAILLYLAGSVGGIVPRETLREAVWNVRFHPGTNALEVQVSRLREKLDKGFATPMLRTEKGVGYGLIVPPHAGD